MKKIILLITCCAAFLGAQSQSLDPSSAGKGYTAYNYAIGNFYDEGSGQVFRKPDGTFFVLFQVNGYSILSHYFSNGAVDPNFGIGGYSQAVGVFQAKAALQPDDKIVIAGQVYNPATSSYDAGVARYNTNGFLDKSFDGDGLQSLDFFNDEDVFTAVVVQPDGKIVTAGYAYSPIDGQPDFALARFNSDGSLDNSFDEDGKQTTDFFGNWDQVETIGLSLNGKIIVAGHSYSEEAGFYRFAIARYNADGPLDKSFSGDGIQTTTFSTQSCYAHGIVAQPDGKFLVAGQVGESYMENSTAVIMRYTINGPLDSSFSGDGRATINFFDSTDAATSIALQADGKIVMGGYSLNPATDREDFVVARFNTNGTWDETFGMQGRTVIDFDGGYDEVAAVLIEPDGKIVASGEAYNTGAQNFDYVIVRYNTDGSLDKNFGRYGTVNGFYEAGESRVDAVGVQKDGKIVVAGGAYNGKTRRDFALARYNANGSLDKSFGNGGKVLTDILQDDDLALDLVIQPDGKIVAAGVAFNIKSFGEEIAMVRYNQDGSPDEGFGNKGRVVTNLLSYNNQFGGLALQPDGKIVIAGAIYDNEQQQSRFLLLRYTASGQPDNTFDGDGMVVTDFPTVDEFVTAVAIQKDGKIVASGYGFSETRSYFMLARYNANGSLDFSFDTDGKVITEFSSDVYATAMLIQPDGKILVSGGYYIFDTDDYDFALARYNINGSLDKSFDMDGKQVTDFKGTDNFGIAIALQPDGKIILLSEVNNKTTGYVDVGLTRYLANGDLDKSFSSDGTLLTHFTGFNNFPTDIVVCGSKAFVSVNATTPADISILAAYELGCQNFATTRMSSQPANKHLLVETATSENLVVKAHPNPSTQYFTLSLQGANGGNAQVRVTDATGRLVELKTNIKSTTQLGANYAAGIYYVEVIQGENRKMVTIVKR